MHHLRFRYSFFILCVFTLFFAFTSYATEEISSESTKEETTLSSEIVEESTTIESETKEESTTFESELESETTIEQPKIKTEATKEETSEQETTSEIKNPSETILSKITVLPIYQSIQIEWKAASDDTEGYRIYRKTKNTRWSIIDIVDNSILSYIDTNANVHTEYIYTVRAYKIIDNKPYFGEYDHKGLTATNHVPSTPALSKTSASQKGIKITWKKSTGANGYYFYRKNSNDDWVRIAQITDLSTLSYTDTAIAYKKSARYTVVAYYENGDDFIRSDHENPGIKGTQSVVHTAVTSIKGTYISSKFTLAKNQSRTIKLTISPTKADLKTVTWKSSNSSIAKVTSSGKVTGIKTGTAKITATATDGSKIKKTFTVTVTNRKTGTNSSESGMSIVSTKTGKYTYSAMQTDLKQLASKYSEFLTYHSLGKTADNRNLYEMILGNPNAKEQVIIQATMHAREYMNSLLVMRQVEFYCRNYFTGTYKSSYYSEIFNNVCIHLIPMTNPDGVSISQFGSSGIKNTTLRKAIINMCKKYGSGKSSYYTRWKANGRGVDLNKNYNLNWYRASSSSHPANYNYKGNSPNSENETKILVNLVKRVDPNVVISYHSTGSIIYWDFAQNSSLQKKLKSLFNTAKSLTGYRSATSRLQSKSSLSSHFGDWICETYKVPTLTIETGTGICPLATKEFSSIWKKNKYMILAVAKWSLSN